VALHDLGALVAEVEFVGRTIVVPALCKDEDVGRAEERIGEYSNGLQVDIGILARSLAGGRAIEIPGGEVLRSVLLGREGLNR